MANAVALIKARAHTLRVVGALLLVGVTLLGCSSRPRSGPRPAPESSVSAQSPYRVAPSLSQEQASDIAIHALGLVGTPYRYGGNTPQGGFDCSGLIGYVYQSRAGVAAPRTVAQLREFGQAVDSDALRSGDLIVFGRSRPTHAGIYVGQGRFVHAPSTGGTVRLDALSGHYWAQQYAQFRRP